VIKGLFKWALAAVVLAACGGDVGITEPVAPNEKTSLIPEGGTILAIGVDSVTGASIETNKDDYSPGEVVHLVGRGWAPGETVNLHMTEAPNTHADVDTSVVADANGGFTLHFYDVRMHDLGVTFTLTATGQTSQSVAVATFTDGNVSLASTSPVAGVMTFALTSGTSCTNTTFTPSTSINFPGGGHTYPDCAEVRAPTTVTVSGVTYTFTSWTVTSLQAGGQTTISHTTDVVGASQWLKFVAPDNNTTGAITANYSAPPSNAEPTLNNIANQSVDEGSALSFTATASDTDTPAQTLTFSLIGAPAGATIGSSSGLFSWTPSDGPAQSTSFTVRVTDNGTPAKFDEQTVNVTIANVAPAATFNAPTSTPGGSNFSISLTTPDDASSNDDAAGFQYSLDCGSGYNAYSGTNNRSCTAGAPGSVTVKGKIKDKDGGEREYTASVAIDNVPPTAEANGPYAVDEGSPVNISGSGIDPDDGAVSYLWSAAPAGKCTFGNATLAATTVTCTDNGSFTLTLKVTDNENVFTTDEATLTVDNVAPTIGTKTSGMDVNEGTNIGFGVGSVTDPSSDDQTTGFTYAFKCGSAPYSAFAGNTVSCPAGDGPGSVIIRAKAKDKDGGESAEVSSTFNVLNVKPTIDAASTNSPLNEGSNATFTVTTASDPWAGDLVGAKYSFACDGVTYGPWVSSNSVNCATTDGPANLTIGAKVQDKDLAESDPITRNVTVENVAPTATFAAQSPVNEGSSFNLSLSNPSDVSSDDVTAGFTYAFDCGDGAGYGLFGATASRSCTTTDNGARNVKGKIRDKDGGEREYTGSVTVNNVAPTATYAADSPVNEGSPFNVALTNPTDVSSADVIAGFTYAFDCGDGAGYGAFGAATSRSCPTTDNGLRSVKAKIRDKDSGEREYTGSVTVNNVPPTIGTVSGAPVAPVPAGTSITMNWDFTDPGSDVWTCSIQWDSGESFASAINNGPNSCSATKALTPGLYTITVKVTDDDGGEGTKTATSYIVVYDPNGSFVTGGGWIVSPERAYLDDLTLTGRANFGFTSKYQPGKNVPTGNTEFQFHAGNLNFKSTVYEWLVVAGTRAQFKGDGTINGVAGYGFLLTAIDDTQDKFRIKIVRKSDGVIVYDNQRGEIDDSPAATTLSGGSIVIHTKK
jgi:hypothetical protein